MIKKLLIPISLAALLLMGSCSTAVHFQALQSAGISLPKNVQTLLVVNRYKPAKKERWKNILEGVITGEMIGADKEGASHSIMSLVNGLSTSPRFKIVQANREMEGSGTEAFPMPYSIAEVQNICKEYNADAIVSLEAFDSDIGIDVKREERTVKADKKDEKSGTYPDVKRTFFVAREKVNLTIGWRVYEATNGALLDEFKQYPSLEFRNESESEHRAKSGLQDPMSAIIKTGESGGALYVPRIAPVWVNISRDIYTKRKGHPEMKDAKKLAIVNEWAKAGAIWEKMATSTDKKLAGRATYNLAVASEASGNLDNALAWAKKSYTDFGNSKAQSYIAELNYRIEDNRRVGEQMAK
jgi:hypothetical protein